MARHDVDRLRDMLDAVERIGRYTVRGRAACAGDELVWTFIVHNLEILGEAAARVGKATRAQASEIPWRVLSAQRSALIHGYFDIPPDLTWTSASVDAPALAEPLRRAIAALTGPV